MDTQLLPKILYIDDNDEARSLVGRLLVGRCAMLDAKEPLAGIQLACESRPDLVLLDMNFPAMNGFEIAARLQDVLKPGPPIVALTADTGAAMRERVRNAGFGGFLGKPIEIDVFYGMIDSLLNGKRDELPDIAGDLQAYRERFKKVAAPKTKRLFGGLTA